MHIVTLPDKKTWPARIQKLPIDVRGYPVPWFVATVNGHPEFRIADPKKWADAVKFKRCWICGEFLGSSLNFVLGPMCCITRTTSEPPCHLECAIFAVMSCPFLNNPEAVRREDELSRENAEPAPGCPINRNPGVSVIWGTKKYSVWHDGGGGALITIGDPDYMTFWSRGRGASRAEVVQSIESGYPALLEISRKEDEDNKSTEATDSLNAAKEIFENLVWFKLLD